MEGTPRDPRYDDGKMVMPSEAEMQVAIDRRARFVDSGHFHNVLGTLAKWSWWEDGNDAIFGISTGGC